MSKRTGTKVQKNRTDDEFIMLPTVDFCFKELMRNEKVRKGIIAALLGVRPEEIKRPDCCRPYSEKSTKTINMEFWMFELKCMMARR